MNRQLPLHLLDYDAFEQLAIWYKENKEHRPHWTINLWQGKFICCHLTFVFGDSQMGHIEQVNDTVEEAVFIALEKFKSLKRQWK